MNIGIDARLLERKITGIGRSLILLLQEIPKYDNYNNYFLFSYDHIQNYYNKKFYNNIITVKSIIPQKIFSPIWSNIILPFYLKKYKIDVLLCVNQLVPLIKIKPTKYISVVHDVIYNADKNFLPFIYRKYLQVFAYFSIKISDAIITVSEYSKNDILKYYKVNPHKVYVVLQSANKNFIKTEISQHEKILLKSRLGLKEINILYVGMIENRKNIIGIVRVADEISKIYQNVNFVLVGKLGYGSKKILNEINLRKNIIYLTNIDDNTLNILYNISDIFLFPSLYEGFGYPPLEAMQCGLPVIASNNTSLIEIIGNGGILVEPNNYLKITEYISKLLNDNDYYKEISQMGIQQSKKFSIDNTAREIVSILKKFDKN